MGGTSVDTDCLKTQQPKQNASWPNLTLSASQRRTSTINNRNAYLEMEHDPASSVATSTTGQLRLVDSDESSNLVSMMANNSIDNGEDDNNNSSSNDNSNDNQMDMTKFKPLQKHVSFTAINIREHSVVLGDHPCCTIGLPVALGWEVQHESSQSLDDYEASRPSRRSRQDMRLSLTDRRALLSDYSDDTVRRVSRQLHKERRCMGRRAKQQFFCTNVVDAPPQAPPVALFSE